MSQTPPSPLPPYQPSSAGPVAPPPIPNHPLDTSDLPVPPPLPDAAPPQAGAGAMPFQPPAAPPVVPFGGVVYKVDSSRASFGELWRDCRSPLIPLVWLSKLLRARLPGSVNDPNVESLRPFEVAPADLPPDVRDRIGPALQDLAAVGFDIERPVAHTVVDLFNNARTTIVTLPRADGRAIGRIHLRTEGTKVPPKTHFFCDVLTELADGTFLWSTAARAVLNAPAGVHVRRHLAATPAQLWAAHEKGLLQLRPAVVPAAGRAGAVDLIERHHARVRDFHLARKLFAPLTDADRRAAAAIDATYRQASAEHLAHPEVLAEMERLQNKRGSWISGLVILAVSLLVFLGAGVGPGGDGGPQDKQSRPFEGLAILVPILFVHELGHYLAMRVFRYRNVRMFFIPFFGAAVTGQNYGAPAWKKVIVTLMGPLPGIAAGAVLGIAGIVLHKPLMMQVAFMALILNGFNLLPVLPLDGGRVMQSLLFSRHYALDVAFRVIAVLALMAGSAYGGGRFLLFLAISMAVGIPVALRMGRLAAELRRQGMAPPPSEQTGIPPRLADTIVGRVKATFPKGAQGGNKALAQHALGVYESLCAQPPGWGATIGFGLLHVGGFVVAAALAVVLAIAQNPSLRGFVQAAAAQARHPIAAADVVRVDGPPALTPAAPAARPATRPASSSPYPQPTRATVYANFASAALARAAFDDVRPRVAAGQSVERFGQTLLVSIPPADDAAHRQWVADLEARTRDVAVDDGEFGAVTLVVSCLAPDAAAAARIEGAAEGYFRTPRSLNLIPPWRPADARTPAERERNDLARRTYVRIMDAGVGAYTDPRMKEMTKRVAAAHRRGDKAEAKRLAAESARLAREIRREAIQALRDTKDGTVDPVVVDAFLSLPDRRGADEAGDGGGDDDEWDGLDPDLEVIRPATTRPAADPFAQPGWRVMLERMGPYGKADDPAALARYAARYGSMIRTGLLLNFQFVSFVDPSEGPRALVNWLDAQGCRSMRYEFRTPAAADPNE